MFAQICMQLLNLVKLEHFGERFKYAVKISTMLYEKLVTIA